MDCDDHVCGTEAGGGTGAGVAADSADAGADDDRGAEDCDDGISFWKWWHRLYTGCNL